MAVEVLPRRPGAGRLWSTRASRPTAGWPSPGAAGTALWDLEAGRWVKVRRTPRNGQGRIVAAGLVFLIAGASHESSGNGLVAYHP
jgi:hypothetical protein